MKSLEPVSIFFDRPSNTYERSRSVFSLRQGKSSIEDHILEFGKRLLFVEDVLSNPTLIKALFTESLTSDALKLRLSEYREESLSNFYDLARRLDDSLKARST